MTVSTTATARRLAATALAVGALSAAVTLPASAADHAPHRQSVEITNVQYDVGRDHSNRALNEEWVELTNRSRESVNLSRWTLSDQEGHTYTFHHYRLRARSSVFVHTGAGRDTHNDLFQGRSRDAWNDHAGTLTLRNDRGRAVDSVSWGHRDDDHRDGDHRGGDHRDGDHRGGDHRGGDHREGDHRDGDHREGDHRGGDHREGDHRGGDHRGGDHR